MDFTLSTKVGMQCRYGIGNRWIDVTPAVIAFFQKGNRLVFPAGPKSFNGCFTDPVPNVVKQLTIELPMKTIVIGEHDNQPYEYEFTDDGADLAVIHTPTANDFRFIITEPAFEDASSIEVLKHMISCQESEFLIEPKIDEEGDYLMYDEEFIIDDPSMDSAIENMMEMDAALAAALAAEG